MASSIEYKVLPSPSLPAPAPRSPAVGVIATHDEYPIERMRLDRAGKWLASVSHDERIKLTDVEDMFEDSDDEGEGGDGAGDGASADGSDDERSDAMEGVQDNAGKTGGFFDDL